MSIICTCGKASGFACNGAAGCPLNATDGMPAPKTKPMSNNPNTPLLPDDRRFKRGDKVSCGTTTVLVSGDGDEDSFFAGVVIEQTNNEFPYHFPVGQYSRSWIAINFKKSELKAQPGAVWVKASERLPGLKTPVKWRLDEVEREGKYPLSEMTTHFPTSLYGWEWLDESPAEQPVIDSELKQEIDHLEKKISMCEDALEKLHAERYETRLALRNLIKLTKLPGRSIDEYRKRVEAAESILNKHSKVTDILRTEAAEQPGREVDARDFAEWLRLYWKASQNGWVDTMGKWETTHGLYLLFQQKSAEWSGEKEVKPGIEVKDGLSFFNTHMPGYTFTVWSVQPEANTLTVVIINQKAPFEERLETDWNLQHTQWAFEKGEYYIEKEVKP